MQRQRTVLKQIRKETEMYKNSTIDPRALLYWMIVCMIIVGQEIK